MSSKVHLRSPGLWVSESRRTSLSLIVLGLFQVSFCCFFRSVRRWRDKVFFDHEFGLASSFYQCWRVLWQLPVSSEFSGHPNLVRNSPSHFFRCRSNRFLAWWCCYLRPVSGEWFFVCFSSFSPSLTVFGISGLCGQLICTLLCLVSFVNFLPHAILHCLVSVSCMPL